MGRDRDLAAVVAAAAAPPSVLIIEGEAGIGKTRLVQELRAHPSMAGRRLVVGACPAIKEPFPLGPVVDALRGLREHLEPASPSPVAGALRPLLPELADVLPPQPEPLASALAERHRVFRALVALLAVLDPLTVVLEDLHWADEMTIDLLRFVLGDLPPGLSLVLTMRAEEAGADIRALTSRLPANRRAHVVLEPLDETQTGDLAASLLASERVTDDFAAELRERTGGLPFAIEEVTALLRDRGAGSAQGRTWTRQELDDLAVPVAVRDHVLARARLLPPAARRLVDIAAVWQTPVPETLIAEVAAEAPEVVTAGLSDAITSGLLVDDAGTIGFRHTLAVQAVYDAIPGPHRRELHNRAASALQSSGAQATGRLAFHLHWAGRLAEWAVVAEQAADRASRVGQYDEAARLLEEVLRHAPVDPASRIRLAVKLGRATRATLRGSRVDDLVAAALELDPPRAVRGELQFLLGALLDDNDLDRQRSQALITEAAANSVGNPEIRARALLALELRSSPETGYAERHRAMAEVVTLIPRIADLDTQVSLLGGVAMHQVAWGDPDWRRTIARIGEYSAASPGHPGQAKAYQSAGQAACCAGHHRVAEELIRMAAPDHLNRDERRTAFARATAALIDYCAGRWDRLEQTVPTLLDQLSSQPWAAYKLYFVAGELAFAQGDLDAAEQWYATLSDKIAGSDGGDLLPMLVASQIRLALARGDIATALAGAERHIARLDAEMLWPATYRCLPWLAAALAGGGDAARAATLGPRYAERLRGRDAPLEPAALAFADGYARAGAGDAAGAAAAFVAAAGHYDALGCPFEAAQAREAAAGSLAGGSPAGSGRGDAAEEPLRTAMAAYERLGASRDLARAGRLARQLGISMPSRHRRGPKGYGTGLTPREREVAELAATGRTNREIAEQLFLSAETVKKHLQSAMRKLEVPSRAALGRRLPSLGTEQAAVRD
ncbi:helix-turn-helix transcriptional regulator [Jiangella rhizosphaerae]|uniref:helix-turn-helix transcriptional regulator n=1 Tax=Jiangella rhizosphaerae TaxID=2293569 RepID=UPI0013147644|nr:LuxR family transcriptional regulator [Jiangella rhizosphaerae]